MAALRRFEAKAAYPNTTPLQKSDARLITRPMNPFASITYLRGVTLVLAPAWLVSCASEPQVERQSSQHIDYVVLTMASLTGGSIQGSVACRDPMEFACLPAGINLMQAVQSCGPEMVTLDTSAMHYQSVSFPAKWPGTPPAVDVVQCVQSKVGLRFSAFIAQGLGTEAGLAGDDKAFVGLHSAPEIAP